MDRFTVQTTVTKRVRNGCKVENKRSKGSTSDVVQKQEYAFISHRGLNPCGPLLRYANLSEPYICWEHWIFYRNFEKLMSLKYAGWDILSVKAEKLAAKGQRRRPCSMCGFIASVIRESDDIKKSRQEGVKYTMQVASLVVQEAKLMALRKTPTPVPRAICLRVAKSIDAGWGSRNERQDLEIGNCEYLIPAPAILPTSKIHRGAWDQDHVDFGLIKSWLDHCKKHENSTHLHCRSSEFDAVSGLNVIDCDTKQLTERPADHLYVALSYVWGPVQKPKDSKERLRPVSLLDAAPRTILDAVAATVALGYRYLWVDRYCIPQDDLEEKKRQLNMMGQIYASADLTIVAAAGENDQFGLPGAGTHPIISRPPRKVAVLRECLFTSVVDLSTLLSETKWKTRGWTFQEAQLSRRRLYFTNSEVVLHCKRHTYYESLTLFDNTLPVAMPSMSVQLPKRLFSQFVHDINAYQERSFTYDSDAMFAFKGILSCYNMYTYWAVPFVIGPNDWHEPVYESYTKSFLSGLCWGVISTNLEIKKRDNMPSWSWISMGTASGRITFQTDPSHLLHIMSRAVESGILSEFRQDFEARSSCEGVRLFVRENDLAVDDSSGWVALDTVVEASPTMAIDGESPHIKIEAPTADLIAIRIIHNASREGQRFIQAFVTVGKMATTLSGVFLDSKYDLVKPMDQNDDYKLYQVEWKLVCVYKWMGYSQSLADDRGGDGAFHPWQTNCLVLARFRDVWKRVGCAVVTTELERLDLVTESFVIS